ncbi:unnamed protein product [Prorocentrum cordatum]|uniref:Uncharacterized protein n=1 Tax=Prorocentrum cordatum TaxID=2364126 RepID=A0ABN9QEB0_9DINO|nr:unnamed protein product [Polarella glacialis]
MRYSGNLLVLGLGADALRASMGADGCHCSCDKELRHIIDLQAEVWALRCLLLAGLLLLGCATSAAGLLGFLAGLCRRCGCGARGRAPVDDMADLLTFDVGDPQILVRYENDPNGFFRHHRLLLFRVSEDIWICLTLDHDLVRVKLLDTRHEGQLLGVGQVDAIERMIWVVAEPRSLRFGEIVDAGVAVLDGEEFFVQKIAASGLAHFKRDAKADMWDARALGDHHDEAGQRILRLSEAVALMLDVEQPNFLLAGVRGVKEFLDSVASGPGNMTSHQAEWARLSGVGEGLAVNRVRRNLCEVIRLMHSWGQVDVSMLASSELLVRWLIQTEIAVDERNPRHPDYSGLDIVISAPVNAVGRASTSKFNTWVTDRLKERATIWKQERLYREEQKQTRKGDGEGSSSLDPSSKRHPKESKGGVAGACGGAGFDSVRALSQLAAANLNSLRAQRHDLPPEGHLRPAAVQRWMLQNVARRVEAYGDCPTDLTEESPLAESFDSRDHYGLEPKNLASFDFDKVKILHRRVHVWPIRRELPPAALGYLRHASDLIERDEAELGKG